VDKYSPLDHLSESFSGTPAALAERCGGVFDATLDSLVADKQMGQSISLTDRF